MLVAEYGVTITVDTPDGHVHEVLPEGIAVPFLSLNVAYILTYDEPVSSIRHKLPESPVSLEDFRTRNTLDLL